MYQILKYFLVRAGLSIFLFLVLDFFALYLVHEIALPQAGFDDGMIQWALFFICAFLGFFVCGWIGNQQFHNAFHALKEAGPLDDQRLITRRFENLLRFTESACFLPGQARRFRGYAVRRYADFLLSIGQEEPKALNIYLKAFLQNPKDSKFRAPLLSILRQGGDLSEYEIDLLLVMLRTEDFKDVFIINHLASIFLRQKKLSGKTERVFLYAVENRSGAALEILKFMIPILLVNHRTDMNALHFYLRALPLHFPDEDEMRNILGRSYCEENFEALDPVLHEKCGQIFSLLTPKQQAEITAAVEESRISGRLKKINLFNRDDIQDFSRLQVRLGMKHSVIRGLWNGILEAGRQPRRLGGRFLLKVIDGAIGFGQARLWVKLTSISAAGVLIFAGWDLMELKTGREEIVEKKRIVPELALPTFKPAAAKREKIHSIQIGAVTSAKMANRFINVLNRKGVKEIFIVKSKRRAGGGWYKIRVGRFDEKDEALRMASWLMDEKLIKNYFIVSTPKSNGPEKKN